MNKHRYLTEFEIDRMAEAAFNAYMMSAERGAAVRAAAEEGWEILGVKPRRSAVLVAYQRSMVMYEAAKMAAKAEGARRRRQEEERA